MTISRTALVVLGAAALILGLSACDPAVPTDTGSSSEPSKPVETVAPEESETPEPEPEAEGLTPADYENIADAVNSGNTAALEGYLTNPVTFIIAASECCGPVTPVEAITNMDYLNSATRPFSWPTPEATVDVYRTGFYVDYFPEGAFVLESADSDPFVVSFTIVGEQITGIFISAGASLLLP